MSAEDDYKPTPSDVLEDYQERCAIMAGNLDPADPMPLRVQRMAWGLMRKRYGDALYKFARLEEDG